MTVAVGVVVDWDIALFGLVVVALGVGNVLAHFLGAKEQKRRTGNELDERHGAGGAGRAGRPPGV